MLILAIMAGCAPALFRANLQLHEKVQSIKTVAIMPPGIKVYQYAFGGGRQLMEDSSATATQHVAGAIEKELGRHAGVVFKPFPSLSAISDTSSDRTAARLKDELEDTQALFEAVSASVLLHTYKHDPDQTFPEKLKNFDYSLGPDVGRLAKLDNPDALLFISGVEHIPPVSTKVLMAVVSVITTAGIIVNPGGIFLLPGLAQGWAWANLSVALVDPTTGALLWYNVVRGSLTYPGSAASLVERVFEGFPVGGTPTRKESDQSAWPIGLGPR